MPPHQAPFDPKYVWVESIQEGRWHPTGAPCRWAVIIDVHNRHHSNVTPRDEEICWYCRKTLVRLEKASKRNTA